MIDATSGSVINDRPTGTTKLMIEVDAGGQSKKPDKDVSRQAAWGWQKIIGCAINDGAEGVQVGGYRRQKRLAWLYPSCSCGSCCSRSALAWFTAWRWKLGGRRQAR